MRTERFLPIATVPKNERVILSGDAYAEPPDDEMALGWVDDDGTMWYAPQGGKIEWKVLYWQSPPAQPMIKHGRKQTPKRIASMKAMRKKNRPEPIKPDKSHSL